LVEFVASHVHTIDQHLAEVWVVELHNKADKRRLALARLAHYSDIVLRIDFEVKALEYPLVLALRVSEPDIFEFYLTTKLLWDDRYVFLFVLSR